MFGIYDYNNKVQRLDREWVDINQGAGGYNIGALYFRHLEFAYICTHRTHKRYVKWQDRHDGFVPSEQWQVKVCQELSAPHLATPCLYKSETEPLGNPSEIGDGNCFSVP